MNIPELETLGYKPNKLTTQTLEKSERGEGLHEVSNAKELIKELNKPEQPEDGILVPIFVPNQLIEHLPSREHSPEQPNQQLMLIQTIQGSLEVVNNNLAKLDKLCQFDSSHRPQLIRQALEDIDIFQKTTLFDLQKAFE